MLKQIKKIAGAVLLALAGFALPQGAQAATLSYGVGDLLMGFYATGGSGVGSSYVVNLGSASGFRDGTTTGALSLGNIGQDLSDTFGANWRTDGNVYWGFIGATSSNVGTTVNGDPGRTLYASSTGSALTRAGSTTQNGVISNINSMLAEQGFTVSGSSTANSNVASLKTNTGLTWNAYADPNVGSGFSYGANLTGSPSASLDLYRIVRTGIDDGTGFTTGSGTLEGYFSINNSGIVSFTAAAVPEPSTYALLGLGLLALVTLRRFRGTKQSNA